MPFVYGQKIEIIMKLDGLELLFYILESQEDSPETKYPDRSGILFLAILARKRL